MGLKLKDIFEGLIKEQGFMPPQPPPLPPDMSVGPPLVDPMVPQPTMVPPPSGMAPPVPPPTPAQTLADRGVVEIPALNMTVAVFAGDSKIVFSRQDHEATTEKIKKYTNLFQRNFRVDSINSLGKGSFEIKFDPRENFMAVVDFLQQLAEHEG